MLFFSVNKLNCQLLDEKRKKKFGKLIPNFAKCNFVLSDKSYIFSCKNCQIEKLAILYIFKKKKCKPFACTIHNTLVSRMCTSFHLSLSLPVTSLCIILCFHNKFFFFCSLLFLRLLAATFCTNKNKSYNIQTTLHIQHRDFFFYVGLC